MHIKHIWIIQLGEKVTHCIFYRRGDFNHDIPAVEGGSYHDQYETEQALIMSKLHVMR